MINKAPRGTVDTLPGKVEVWQKIEQTLRGMSLTYNYKEIRTPLFENTEVFQRGVGETTDIVQKEMYTFYDQGGRSQTLRPEGTAGVIRSYIENKMYGNPSQPTKLYYFSQMFRYERPEKGRFRQLHQFGVEVLGSEDPAVDAEVIAFAMRSYEKLGLKNIKLVLNTLGDKESRVTYRDALTKYFKPNIEDLCKDCQNRLESNPLRILDCKRDMDNPIMKGAPTSLDYLNEESNDYFQKLKDYLDVMEIEYIVDTNLVRGLDYYNHTVFEIMSTEKGFGAGTTLLGGGRYNGLVETLGGPQTPGIGFGMGIERLILALEKEEVELTGDSYLDAFFVTMGDEADIKAVSLQDQLRVAGYKVDKDYQGRKMRGQFKEAERNNARNVIIIGDNELKEGKVVIRDLSTGDQKDVPFNRIQEEL